MLSEEGEKVGLARVFNPGNAGGNVEKWLIECENSMRETVKAEIRKAFDAYSVSKRSEWVIEWPGQVVICVGSMFWTAEVEDAISDSKLKQYADQCTSDLMDIVDKVRCDSVVQCPTK